MPEQERPGAEAYPIDAAIATRLASAMADADIDLSRTPTMTKQIWTSTSDQSSEDTRTPSPRSAATWMDIDMIRGALTPPVAAMSGDSSGRFGVVDRAIFERDSRIEELEERLRVLSAALAACVGRAVGSAKEPAPTQQLGGRRDQVEEALQLLEQRNEEDAELEETVEAAVRKSEALLEAMSGLANMDEPERLRTPRTPAHDASRERLAQIDSLVQRRMEQLPSGDPELKFCRVVRSLCGGAQRAAQRRWSTSES